MCKKCRKLVNPDLMYMVKLKPENKRKDAVCPRCCRGIRLNLFFDPITKMWHSPCVTYFQTIQRKIKIRDKKFSTLH